METFTIDHAKVGTIAYRATIGRDDGDYLETIESEDFVFESGARLWGLARLESFQASNDGHIYDASIKRIRWIEDTYPDSEFGLVHDAIMQQDETYLLYCNGDVWRERHMLGSPRWE